jgi:hypothetical protein
MKLQRPDPGIDAAKSGLHGKAGIFFNAGLFLKGGGFNILDLDPYLLFDAETSMRGTLEAFTLDLDPANPSSLDVITATRSGVATFTDANGLIQSASPNTVRVDQTQGAELTPTVYQHIGYTDFSSGWTGIRTQTQQATGHLGFPSQLITRINESSGSAGNYYFSVSSLTDGQTYRYSLYIRRITGTSDITLRHRYAVEGSDSLVSVTQDWQRFEVNATKAVGSDIQFGVTIADFGDQIEIAMPQVEEGTTASDFVANTTGSPKFITGPTFGPRVPMILVEPSATNLVTNTDFSSGWGLQSSTKQETDITSPFQSQNALRVTASETYGRIQDYIGSSSVTTISVYVKRDSTDSRVSINSDGFGAVTFNLTQAGASYHSLDGSPAGYDIKEHGDGWWRISASFSSVDYFKLYPDIELGTRSVLFALPQVEAGSVATSLIPTSGGNTAARTRAADDLVISGSAFTDFFNSGGDGTFYAEFITRTITEEQIYVLAGHSSVQRYLYSNTVTSTLNSYDGSTGSISTAGIQSTLNRASISYNSNSRKGSLNGSTDSNHSGSGNLRDSTRLSIGQSWISDKQLNGHLKRLIYWPTHSDNL